MPTYDDKSLIETTGEPCPYSKECGNYSKPTMNSLGCCDNFRDSSRKGCLEWRARDKIQDSKSN